MDTLFICFIDGDLRWWCVGGVWLTGVLEACWRCVGGVWLTSSVEMCVVGSEYRRLSTDIQLVNVDSFILICVLSPVFYKCLSLLLKGVNGWII